MIHYLAYVWDPNDPMQCHSAADLMDRTRAAHPTWRLQARTPGLAICCPESQADAVVSGSTANDSLTLLGMAFTEGASTRRVRDIEMRNISASFAGRANHIVESIWGSYVGFIYDRESSSTTIIRAAMGMLNCFHTVSGGVNIFFSTVEDCLSLKAVRLSINWEYVAAHVVLGGSRGSATALREITELLPGEAWKLAGDKFQKTQLWDPVRFARASDIDDFDTATRVVRETATSVIAALAAEHPNIVLKLSGGLDSSIVLGCLSALPNRPNVTCITDYSPGSDSDERFYARTAAEHSRYELIEHERDASLDLDDLSTAARTTIPTSYFMERAAQRPAIELARARGASAVFGGVGGDEVFCRGPILASVTDFVQTRRLRPALLGNVAGVAYSERLSYWSVIKSAIAASRRAPRSALSILESFQELDPGNMIINRGALDAISAEKLLHPWLRDSDGLPEGKVFQVMGLALASREDPFGQISDPLNVQPLLSQPIVEVCLRTPLYVQIRRGWDRAVAREAFATVVPKIIVRRKSKGGMEEYAQQVMARNINFLRPTLLDGVLVRENLLCRQPLEEALTSQPTKSATWPGYMLAAYVGTELWLRRWLSEEVRAVA